MDEFTEPYKRFSRKRLEENSLLMLVTLIGLAKDLHGLHNTKSVGEMQMLAMILQTLEEECWDVIEAAGGKMLIEEMQNPSKPAPADDDEIIVQRRRMGQN